jgi:hypothetical protein
LRILVITAPVLTLMHGTQLAKSKSKPVNQHDMEANSSDQKTFQLVENGQPLGKLVYKNLFFLKAEIMLANSEIYKINPVGIFSTSMIITKNGVEIANLKMNWKGQILFSFQNGQEFVLKAKGIFSNKFIIENKNKEKIAEFDSEFSWRKFNYQYHITYEEKPQDILFVLLGVYASNYYIASMSGATSGMV